MLQLSTEKALRYQVSLEKRFKKLVSVLAIFILVTRTGEKADEIAEIAKTAEIVETVRANKDSKKSKGSENPRSNFARVLCIR